MIGKDINIAYKLLNNNELVAIPTETVYGLAGNAFSEEAVIKIFETKQRPQFDPLIVHAHSIEAIKEFVTEVPDFAKRLFKKFSPGSITILLPKNDKIPDLVTSGLPNVAVRIPNHPLTLELLRKVSFPLAAPSANPFGYISPTSAAHVSAQLGSKIPYILDGGECTVGIESTIVGIENGKVIIYRLGGLPVNEIESVVGYELEIRTSTSSPNAPGMLKSHYAPSKKMIIGNIEELLKDAKMNYAILSFSDTYNGKYNQVLSEKGDMSEAAKNLFSMMRKLDSIPEITHIFAEYVPNVGLGLAINDRLRRASAD